MYKQIANTFTLFTPEGRVTNLPSEASVIRFTNGQGPCAPAKSVVDILRDYKAECKDDGIPFRYFHRAAYWASGTKDAPVALDNAFVKNVSKAMEDSLRDNDGTVRPLIPRYLAAPGNRFATITNRPQEHAPSAPTQGPKANPHKDASGKNIPVIRTRRNRKTEVISDERYTGIVGEPAARNVGGRPTKAQEVAETLKSLGLSKDQLLALAGLLK